METTTAADLKRFTHPAAWGGGAWHGLTLRYTDPSPARLQAARDVLWAYPGLEGCWRRNDREPAAAARIRSTYGLPASRPLYGFARLSGTGGGENGPPWRDEVDTWLRGLAEHVHREVPFELGLVGWPTADLNPETAEEVLSLESPANGYLVPSAGALDWYPPNQEPPILDLIAFD